MKTIEEESKDNMSEKSKDSSLKFSKLLDNISKEHDITKTP